MLLSSDEKSQLFELRFRLYDLSTKTPDEKLTAFLRVAEGDVERAEEMFRKQLVWRRNNEIESLATWKSPKTYYPILYSGSDLDGGPVYIMPIGHWDTRSAVELGEIVPGLRFILKTLDGIVSATEAKGFYQITVILDFEGFTYYQMAHSSVLQGAFEILSIIEANYPEIIKVAFVINAPRVFHLLWALVKPFLHARTVSKFEIFGY
jgi:hypothetical protein